MRSIVGAKRAGQQLAEQFERHFADSADLTSGELFAEGPLVVIVQSIQDAPALYSK